MKVCIYVTVHGVTKSRTCLSDWAYTSMLLATCRRLLTSNFPIMVDREKCHPGPLLWSLEVSFSWRNWAYKIKYEQGTSIKGRGVLLPYEQFSLRRPGFETISQTQSNFLPFPNLSPPLSFSIVDLLSSSCSPNPILASVSRRPNIRHQLAPLQT